MVRVDIAPSLFRWARERASLKPEDLASGFPQLQAWERGESKPTLKQLENYAKKTHVPLGYFFLAEPPIEQLPVADYRTQRDRGVRPASPELLDTLNRMLTRQAWMREYLEGIGADPLPFVSSVPAGTFPGPVAEAIRSTLRLDRQWARQYPSWQQALKGLLEASEAAGILFSVNGVVDNNTSRILDPEEFRGFVLVDPFAPLIFVNGTDAKSAQMFTVAHELAHIWIGQSGLFDLPNLDSAGNDIEAFCNAVAAEFLVPEIELRSAWPAVQSDSEPFDELARSFKVSAVVIARRARDLGLVSSQSYTSFFRARMLKEREKPDGASGGNFCATQNYRLGRSFATAVMRSAKAGNILYRDAYQLLGIKGKTYDSYAQELGI